MTDFHALFKPVQHLLDNQKAMLALGCLAMLGAIGIMLTSQNNFWGFVQDDAYISLRYSYNLVEGNGLVFNVGERVEGYSNFLWTLLGALFLALGVDAIACLTYVGAASALLLLIVVFIISRQVRGEAKPLWDALPALLLAGSATAALWSVSGLEQAFFALCGWGGVMFALLGRMRLAGLLILFAILTRPEGLLFLFFTLYLAFHSGRFEVLPKRKEFIKVSIGVITIFAIYFAWRLWYFGDPLPNTYYVKGGGGLVNAEHGWSNFKKLWDFNGNGALMMLAPFALIPKKGRLITLAFLIFQVGYCLYEIKIGGDFLPMFRLHLTTLPAQCFLAAKGIEGLSIILPKILNEQVFPWRYIVTPLLVLGILGPISQKMISFSWKNNGYENVSVAIDKVHGEIGRYLDKHTNPGDVVILAQDMGVLPWNAKDLFFLDSIGLVDSTIAHTQYDNNYTPQIRYLLWNDPEARKKIARMEAKIRRYIFSKNPRYAVVNADFYHVEHNYKDIQRAIDKKDKAFFKKPIADNPYFHRINRSKEWKNYKLIRGWEYSPKYWLLLFEKSE